MTLEHPWLSRVTFRLIVLAVVVPAAGGGSLQAKGPRAAVRRVAVAPPNGGHTAVHGGAGSAAENGNPYPYPPGWEGADLLKQTAGEAAARSEGCIQCHKDSHDPHGSKALHLGCTDCHGGNARATDKQQAHVHPRIASAWPESANPVRSYTLLNHESPEYTRFVNPGDLRVAHISCGGCHPKETLEVRKSMMTHGCMLWGAALYNNGSVPFKWPRYGESYSMHGAPQRLQTVPPPTAEETARKGVLPFLDPLPRFQVTQPGNILRIFERGGRFTADAGIPIRFEEPGRPRMRTSNRGLGTLNRTDPVFVSLQKTRLFDPTLNFMGTNDHPGDYRSSGCTACHMVYANDRSPVHSGPYAKYGNRGRAAAAVDEIVRHVDPTIPTEESGHPIHHRFTRAIPTSQCLVCHVHPGTNVLNSYVGYTWWDLETDGQMLYPPVEKDPSSEEFVRAQMSNPNDAAARGLWSDPEFLAEVSGLNPSLRHTQFADFHGHGWIFRAVFKKDRDGTLLDHEGTPIPQPSNRQLQLSVLIPEYVKQLYQNRTWTEEDMAALAQQERELEKLRQQVPVHLLDVHMEKGMHCVDCHFVQDVHGNGKLYGEVRAAVEIRCVDCHGDVDRVATSFADRPQMRTSGPAADERGTPEKNGRELTTMLTPFGKKRFEVRGDRVIQRSMVDPSLSWSVTQVMHTIDPGHESYNAGSALAKTVRLGQDGEFEWGDTQAACAHDNRRMSCAACHTSWNPSCYGCHLPQKAEKKMPDLHNEADITKNYVSYNFQTLRDEVFMLARDGNVTGNRINPSRSSCAIHVGSYNANRESIYVQQQTISGEGLSGIAFSTNVPHTVRGKGETRTCSDCHVAATEDNNAIVAQTLMHGTGFLNFIGRYCWVAAGNHGIHAVTVTERDEPQTVIGSSMHRLVYPQRHSRHLHHKRQLQHAHEHPGNDIGDNIFRPFTKSEILDLQLRGEFLYAACGEAGFRVFDVAFIDNKGFSERMTTAPVSPVGQKFYLRTKYCTSVAAPTTMAPDPTRVHFPENDEQEVHPLYGYLYVTDRHEGLILVSAGSLLDGNPTNNFLKRELTFNPDGLLAGAESVTIAGTYAYVCCRAGLVVIDLSTPTSPRVTSVVGNEAIVDPTCVQVQFRYGFVCDSQGVKVLDMTDPSSPVVAGSLPLEEAHNIYVARTYAYVAAGSQGLVILDIRNPRKPVIDQVYDAHGTINECHDVQLGITYASLFAYLADGANGMRVVQLTSPETPGNGGFSPRPNPNLIATFRIPKGGHALAISRGVDRDRAVDESGNQIAVFGRVGARPLNLPEQRRMYVRSDGRVWKVADPRRDFTIASPRLREFELTRQIEEFYGPHRMRSGQAGRAGTSRRSAR